MQEMTEDQRVRFGRAVASRTVGMGSKSAVYKAANVSAPTLERVLEGKSVKPFTVTAIVNALWPSAGGDWRQVAGVAEEIDPLDPLSQYAPNDSFEVNFAIREIVDDLLEAKERIRVLERQVFEAIPRELSQIPKLTDDLAARRAEREAEVDRRLAEGDIKAADTNDYSEMDEQQDPNGDEGA